MDRSKVIAPLDNHRHSRLMKLGDIFGIGTLISQFMGATTNSGAGGPPHPGPRVTVSGGVLPASAVCRHAGWMGDGDEDADGLEDLSEEGVR